MLCVYKTIPGLEVVNKYKCVLLRAKLSVDPLQIYVYLLEVHTSH